MPNSNSFVANKELLAISLARDGSGEYGRSRFPEAELLFRQALYLEPKARNVKINLALSLTKQQKFEEAAEILASLPVASDAEKIQELQADLYYAWEKYEQAEKMYQGLIDRALAISDFPRAARYARSASVLAFKIGDEEKALCYSGEAYNSAKSVEELGRHVKLMLALGLAANAQGLIAAETLVLNAKSDPKLLYLNALARLEMGDGKSALEDLNRSYDLTPSASPEKSDTNLFRQLLTRQLNGDKAPLEKPALEAMTLVFGQASMLYTPWAYQKLLLKEISGAQGQL